MQKVMHDSNLQKLGTAFIIFLLIQFSEGWTCFIDSRHTSRMNNVVKSCGSKRAPCTTIQECNKKSEKIKEMVIRGEYMAEDDPISIRHNFSIVGSNSVIKMANDATPLFQVSSPEAIITLKIKNMHFKDKGIVRIGSNVEVSIENCSYIGTEKVPVVLESSAQRVSLKLTKSYFIDITQDGTLETYTVHREKGQTNSIVSRPLSMIVKDCKFEKGKGLYIQSKGPTLVVIENTQFKQSKCTSVMLRGNRNLNQTVIVSNSSISEAEKPEKGCRNSPLTVIDYSNVLIRYSSFFRNEAGPYGAFSIVGVRSTFVYKSTFNGNIAPGRQDGAAISVSNSTAVNIVSSAFMSNKAIQGGAIAVRNTKSAAIENCTFLGNSLPPKNIIDLQDPSFEIDSLDGPSDKNPSDEDQDLNGDESTEEDGISSEEESDNDLSVVNKKSTNGGKLDLESPGNTTAPKPVEKEDSSSGESSDSDLSSSDKDVPSEESSDSALSSRYKDVSSEESSDSDLSSSDKEVSSEESSDGDLSSSDKDVSSEESPNGDLSSSDKDSSEKEKSSDRDLTSDNEDRTSEKSSDSVLSTENSGSLVEDSSEGDFSTENKNVSSEELSDSDLLIASKDSSSEKTSENDFSTDNKDLFRQELSGSDSSLAVSKDSPVEDLSDGDLVSSNRTTATSLAENTLEDEFSNGTSLKYETTTDSSTTDQSMNDDFLTNDMSSDESLPTGESSDDTLLVRRSLHDTPDVDEPSTGESSAGEDPETSTHDDDSEKLEHQNKSDGTSTEDSQGCKESTDDSWCITPRGGSVFMKNVATSIFRGNIFENCESDSFGGCVFIDGADFFGVLGSNVFQNCSATPSGGCIFISDTRRADIKGNNVFKNSYTQVNGGAVLALNVTTFNIIGNNTFTDCDAIASGGCIHVEVSGVVHIIGSKFVNGVSNRGGGCISIQETNTLRVEESEFKKCTTGGAGGAILLYSVDKGVFQRSDFQLNNGTQGGAVCIVGTTNIILSSSYFQGNIAEFEGGAFAAKNDRKIVENRIFEISSCVFSNNSAKQGGALHVSNQINATVSQYFIVNCNFSNNRATELGQSIYNNEYMHVQNISVEAYESIDQYHVYSEVAEVDLNNLVIKIMRHRNDSRFSPQSSGLFLSSSKIKIDEGLTLLCPMGLNAKLKKASYVPMLTYKSTAKKPPPLPPPIYTYLTATCESCSYTKYTLSRGKLQLFGLSNESDSVVENKECFNCKPGGVCDIDVRAVDNYWGVKTNTSEVKFYLCPSGYCCSLETVECVSFDTCAVGRSGTLCGSCAEGFKQSFLTNGCIAQGEHCDFVWFVIYMVLFSFLYTVTFICITNLKDILTTFKNCFRPQTKDIEGNVEIKPRNEEEDDFAEESSSISPASTFSIAAFIQIVVLYFQVASILKVKFQGRGQKEKSGSTNKVLETIFTVFNFRFTLYQGVCPSDDLTLPQKEMILFGNKLLTFIELILFLGIWFLACHLCCKRTPLVTEESISLTNPSDITLDIIAQEEEVDSTQHIEGAELHSEGRLNFGHRLKLTYIKLLKLYFTPVTKSALAMIYCVRILDQHHLFVYGDLVCYTNWQIAIIAVILPGLLLFPISFELAIRLLKKRLISSTMFVSATAIPYLSLWLYIQKILCGRKKVKEEEVASLVSHSPSEEAFARCVLEGEEELFSVDECSLGWQVHQFYRTLMMNVVNIFFTNPVYRTLAFTPVLVGFFIHDIMRQPYKDTYLNRLQSLSSLCLLCVLSCNSVSSTSFIFDATNVQDIDLVIRILAVVEMALYCVVPLSLPLWKLYMILIKRNDKQQKTD